MKLKGHIITHSLIHTFKQLKMKKTKVHYLINSLQPVQNVSFFQQVEDDIRRYFFEQHLQRMYIKVLFSDVNQIRTKKS